MTKGIKSVQFVSRDISLSQGDSKVEVKVVANNKTYHDE